VKDALDRKLHRLVCAGELDLETAQQAIASNWIEAYKKYVSEHPPAPPARETKAATSDREFGDSSLPVSYATIGLTTASRSGIRVPFITTSDVKSQSPLAIKRK
jgi:hypothetical protein